MSLPREFYNSPSEWFSYQWQDLRLLFRSLSEGMTPAVLIKDEDVYRQCMHTLIQDLQNFKGTKTQSPIEAYKKFETSLMNFISKASIINPDCFHEAGPAIKALLFSVPNSDEDIARKKLNTMWNIAAAAKSNSVMEEARTVWAGLTGPYHQAYGLHKTLRLIESTGQMTSVMRLHPWRSDLMHFVAETGLWHIRMEMPRILKDKTAITMNQLKQIAQYSLRGSSVRTQAGKIYQESIKYTSSSEKLREVAAGEDRPDNPEPG